MASTESMKAIVKPEPGPGLELQQRPIPQPGSKDVLVEVLAASICGTDLHIYNWDQWSAGRIKPPRIVGHELAGRVIEVGAKVTNVAVGDMVSAETHWTCGKCDQCRRNQAHYCPNTKILGVDFDGCFAKYVSFPAKCAWKNPPGMSPEIACLQEPLGNAVYAATEHELTGRIVAVTGLGPFGLFAVAIAKVMGASHVIGIEPNAFRAQLGYRMGADEVLNPKQDSTVERFREITGGHMADVLLEMSGNPNAIRIGFELLAYGGSVSLFGLPPGPVQIDLADAVIFRGAKIYGISGRKIFDTWFQASRLLNSGRLDIRPVITHQLPMSRFEEGLRLMSEGQSGKVVLIPDF
ncbi:MAG: L-threonine 3-dehydrogenase [Candidatus Alcyoniella australis]|nr:L-threonine 3-dehydrogenase [Candidatus Alcyoniella australis]